MHTQEMATDIEAMLMRVKGDQTLALIQDARDRCAYDECTQLCKDALAHYKVTGALNGPNARASARTNLNVYTRTRTITLSRCSRV